MKIPQILLAISNSVHLFLKNSDLTLEVPLPEEAPGPLLEAVGLLLAVPDGPG